jgi:hypothetical protein
MNVNISDRDYHEIISELGYPVIKEEDLEFSREDIQELFVYPALREYFTWFPNTEEASFQVAGKFSFPFPDENTYGVVSARLNSSSRTLAVSGNPFINERNLTINRGHSYGTDNDYGFIAANVLERSEALAFNNSSRAFRFKVNDKDRTLTGYSNVTGEAIVQWAKYSEDMNDVPFAKRNEVLKLAKAKVLQGFSMLRGQIDPDMGSNLDISIFQDKARALEEEVYEKWRTLTKVVVIRG